MKKVLLSTFALGLLFATSCKKKDDNGTPSNTFKIGSTSYSATTVQAASTTLIAESLSGSTVTALTFEFSALPTASGTYTVVSSASPTANQVSVLAVNSSGTNYQSTGNDKISAAVSVSGGKITVSLPSTWTKNTSGTDSVQVSGNVTQQ